jgi:hypothetical protein
VRLRWLEEVGVRDPSDHSPHRRWLIPPLMYGLVGVMCSKSAGAKQAKYRVCLEALPYEGGRAYFCRTLTRLLKD